MSVEWLAILMFAGFFFLLLTGYPVAFSFAGTAIVFGLLGLAVEPVFRPPAERVGSIRDIQHFRPVRA